MDKEQGKKIVIVGIIQAVIISVFIPFLVSKTIWEADSWDSDKEDNFSLPSPILPNPRYELFIEEFFSSHLLTQGWVIFENIDTGESFHGNYEITSYTYYQETESTRLHFSLTPGSYRVTWNNTMGSFDTMRLTMIGLLPETVGYVIIGVSVILGIGLVIYVQKEFIDTKKREKYRTKNPFAPTVGYTRTQPYSPPRPYSPTSSYTPTPSYGTSASNNVQYCPNCGKQNSKDNKFCYDCGSQI